MLTSDESRTGIRGRRIVSRRVQGVRMLASWTTTRGPSFSDLRPAGEPVDAGVDFPVYDRLVDTLARPPDTPDDVVRHVLATCCGYAYGDKDVVAMMLARMGLERINLAEITMSVDAMLLR